MNMSKKGLDTKYTQKIVEQVVLNEPLIMKLIIESFNKVMYDGHLSNIEDLLIEEIDDTYLSKHLQMFAIQFLTKAITKLYTNETFVESIQRLINGKMKTIVKRNQHN